MAEQSTPASKVLFSGQNGVGKTSLLMLLRDGRFPDTNGYVPSVINEWEIDVGTQKLRMVEAEDDELSGVRALWYLESKATMLCFSVDSPASLQLVKDRYCIDARRAVPSCPVVLVALKVDLRDDQKTVDDLAGSGQAPVSREQGEEMAKEVGALAYVECSAITGHSAREVLEIAAEATLTPDIRMGNRSCQLGCCCAIL